MKLWIFLFGRRIGEELRKKNEIAGLYAFMSGAMYHQQCGLANIYVMTIAYENSMIRNEDSSQKRGNRSREKMI